MKNKRNLNTKWLLQQNDQNADTTLLHSHDDLFWLITQNHFAFLNINAIFEFLLQFTIRCIY